MYIGCVEVPLTRLSLRSLYSPSRALLRFLISIFSIQPYIFFHHTAPKVRTVRPAGEKQPTHFTLLVEKISICTTGVSKESFRSHIFHPRLLHARVTIICDLRHSLLLLPRCIIYYSSTRPIKCVLCALRA